MLLKGIYVLSLQFSCSVEITKKTNVQIINNKEAPWITLSKQHLAHDSQLEQQLSLGSLLLRDAHCGNNQFLAINWIWMKFAKMLFFLQDWILNFMRENSNFASVWFFAAAESSLVLSWHFSIAYKGIKRKKEKNLHEVEQRLGKLLPLHANFENHAQSSGEALTSLLYETYLASRLTYFSNLPAPKLLWV